MSVSFEALAMAGADYNECGMSMEEWERSEMTTPPHLLAEEEEREDYKGHLSLKELPSSSKILEENREKCKGEKKLALIGKVKKFNLVKQLSSKTMMIDNILATEMRSCASSKFQPAEKWKYLFRVLVIEFKRIFSVS